VDEVVQRIIDVLKEEDPERVYLFGSRADGTARPDSDYDICLLKRFDESKWSNEGKRIYHKLRKAVPDVYTDLILYTPDSFLVDKEYKGYIAYQIYKKGIIVYESARRA
jgi:predicted nucleotidyltransferase